MARQRGDTDDDGDDGWHDGTDAHRADGVSSQNRSHLACSAHRNGRRQVSRTIPRLPADRVYIRKLDLPPLRWTSNRITWLHHRQLQPQCTLQSLPSTLCLPVASIDNFCLLQTLISSGLDLRVSVFSFRNKITCFMPCGTKPQATHSREIGFE